MTSPRGPRKKSPIGKAKKIIARRIWGDKLRKIPSGIHETGARSSRSLKPVRLGGLRPLKPRTAPMRRSSPRTGRVRRSR